MLKKIAKEIAYFIIIPSPLLVFYFLYMVLVLKESLINALKFLAQVLLFTGGVVLLIYITVVLIIKWFVFVNDLIEDLFGDDA